jgi:hypothetical protein
VQGRGFYRPQSFTILRFVALIWATYGQGKGAESIPDLILYRLIPLCYYFPD